MLAGIRPCRECNRMTKSGFGADFDAEKLDLPVEVAALDLQIIRCFGDVPRALAKLAADVFTLKGRPGFPQRCIIEGRWSLRRVQDTTLSHQRRCVRGLNIRSPRHDHRALYKVSQFPNIAGPVVSRENIQGVMGNLPGAQSLLLDIYAEEVADQRRDVFPALPQRREIQLKHRQPEIQSLAKST